MVPSSKATPKLTKTNTYTRVIGAHGHPTQMIECH
jgi:hypothetical protein